MIMRVIMVAVIMVMWFMGMVAVCMRVVRMRMLRDLRVVMWVMRALLRCHILNYF
jgi:hypothetical protein